MQGKRKSCSFDTTLASVSPPVFLFQSFVNLEYYRADLDYIQHTVKARPSVRLICIRIFLTAFRPALAQLAAFSFLFFFASNFIFLGAIIFNPFHIHLIEHLCTLKIHFH